MRCEPSFAPRASPLPPCPSSSISCSPFPLFPSFRSFPFALFLLLFSFSSSLSPFSPPSLLLFPLPSFSSFPPSLPSSLFPLPASAFARISCLALFLFSFPPFRLALLLFFFRLNPGSYLRLFSVCPPCVPSPLTCLRPYALPRASGSHLWAPILEARTSRMLFAECTVYGCCLEESPFYWPKVLEC